MTTRHSIRLALLALVLLPALAGAQTTTSTSSSTSTSTIQALICGSTNRVPVGGTGAFSVNDCVSKATIAAPTTSTSTSTSSSTSSSTTSSTSSSTVTTSTSSTSSSTSTSTSTSSTTTSSTSTTIVGITWAVRQGGANSDNAFAVADAGGSLVAVGNFRETATLSATSGSPATLTSLGNSDVWIAKYTANGILVWSARYGGTSDETFNSVAVDAGGDVYVAGKFSGTANFGGSNLTSAGGQDMVLAKYRGTDGAHLWSKRFGGVNTDDALAVTTDASGNVLLTGYFSGTVNFGGSDLTVPFTSDLDVFIAKFNSAGTHIWSEHFTNDGNEKGFAISCDSSSRVMVTGYFTNDVDFGGGTLTASSPYSDGFVAVFTSAGAHVWSKRLGANDGNDILYGGTFDAAGNVLVAGYALKAVDYGGGTLAALGGSDVIVAKFASANGAHTWSKRAGGSGNDYGWAVGADGSSNVYLVGSFQSTSITIAGTTLTNNQASNDDAFLAKYQSDGTAAGARRLGGTGQDVPNKLAVQAAHVAIAGYFYGIADLDGTSLTSAGLADGFVVRMTQ